MARTSKQKREEKKPSPQRRRKINVTRNSKAADPDFLAAARQLKKDVKEDVNPGRKLDRRNTEQVAARSIRLKLGMYPRAQIDNHVDAQGVSIDQKVQCKVRELRGSRAHIPVSFWRSIVVDHALTREISSTLKPPEVREEVDRELDKALKLCHHDNPAMKSTEALTRLLTWRKTPWNRTETYGLLVGSMESPSLSAKASRTMMESMLEFIARTNTHEEFADFWTATKQQFDMILVCMWRKAQSNKVSRVNFLRARRRELSLFINMTEATEIEKCLAEGKDPPQSLLRQMYESTIGGELFLPEHTKSQVTSFLEDINTRIYNLEYHNFDATEIANFEKLMQHAAGNLDSDMLQEFDKCDTSISFCGANLSKQVNNMNDYWGWRWQSRYKTIAISNCQAPRTKWEELLWGTCKGAIADVPGEVIVPQDLLFDDLNVREHVNKLLGTSWMTVQKMRDIVNSNEEEFIKMNESFWMEIAFLNTRFDPLLLAHLRSCLLAILPDAGEIRSLPKAVTAARALATGQVATAAGRDVEKELMSVVNLLQDICDARSPCASETLKMSSFVLQCLKKAENCCVTTHEEPLTENGTKMRRKQLLAGAALDHLVAKSLKLKSGPLGPDLKQMRQFRWMLSIENNKLLDGWIKDAVVMAKDKLTNARHAALQDIERRLKEVPDLSLVPAPCTIATPAFGNSSSSKTSKPIANAETLESEEHKEK